MRNKLPATIRLKKMQPILFEKLIYKKTKIRFLNYFKYWRLTHLMSATLTLPVSPAALKLPGSRARQAFLF